MRTLVLSDLHIGDPRYIDNKVVQELLKIEKYDKLIINGDFLDLWFNDIFDIGADPLLILIEKISYTKKVIWVIGNHDMDILNFGHMILHRVPKVEFIEINENNKKILVIHGHQIYRNQNNSWLVRLLSKMNKFLYQHYNIDIDQYICHTYFYKRYVKAKRKAMLEKYGDKAQTIIIGHTHLIGYCSSEKTELFDMGSSVKTRSYAIIENGIVRLGIGTSRES